MGHFILNTQRDLKKWVLLTVCSLKISTEGILAPPGWILWQCVIRHACTLYSFFSENCNKSRSIQSTFNNQNFNKLLIFLRAFAVSYGFCPPNRIQLLYELVIQIAFFWTRTFCSSNFIYIFDRLQDIHKINKETGVK